MRLSFRLHFAVLAIGVAVPTASFGVGLPDPTNPNRQLRATVTIVGPITLGGSITVS